MEISIYTERRKEKKGRKKGLSMECELCGGEATTHCERDSAFLCWACDATVHGANFLAARHRRRRLGGARGREVGGAWVDVVVGGWCERAGVRGGAAAAGYAVAVGRRRAAAVPLRVSMAAAVWFAAKVQLSAGRLRRGRVLRSLAGLSGVPAALISAGEAELSRAMRWSHARYCSEGSAECGA
ncbi:uncharacterized protein LOC144712675 [Wolffia australiana]